MDRFKGFPGGASSKETTRQCRRQDAGILGVDPWVRKIPWKRAWQQVFLPGESHGQRSLVAYSSWDHKELDMTE